MWIFIDNIKSYIGGYFARTPMRTTRWFDTSWIFCLQYSENPSFKCDLNVQNLFGAIDILFYLIAKELLNDNSQ